MEIRKIQLTGGSSFVLTLPKDWIKSHGLAKNAPVGLITQSDGTLLVTPRISSEQTQLVSHIKVDGSTQPENLFRMLIGTYIMGYTSVEITAPAIMPIGLRQAVIRFTQSAIGPEVVEDTEKYILVKDLLNPTEMAFDKTIKRMHLLTESMHRDALASLTASNPQLAEGVIDRDRELDRLHWLVSRQANLVLREAVLAKKMNVSLEEATTFSLIGRILERMGDHATQIAQNSRNLAGSKVDGAIVEKIGEISAVALSILKKSVEAWFEEDIEKANANVNSLPNFVLQCERTSHIIMKVKGQHSIFLSNILESIRRTGEYSGDISELVVNNLVE